MAVLRAAVIIVSDVELVAYLQGQTLAAAIDLVNAVREGMPYPPLYKSGVRYTREPPGSEVWQLPRSQYASLKADCEDLATWRCAECWLAGETGAEPYVRRINARLRHILVRRADGTIEDPSLCLGMHDRADKSEAPAALAKVKPIMPTPSIPLPNILQRLLQ